jgi:hypothetical protein
VNNEQTRSEIRSTLLRARRAMLQQAQRMRALGEGRPDPAPEMDEEFVDDLVREHVKARSGAP